MSRETRKEQQRHVKRNPLRGNERRKIVNRLSFLRNESEKGLPKKKLRVEKCSHYQSKGGGGEDKILKRNNREIRKSNLPGQG